MKFILEIDTDNDAFSDESGGLDLEVARLLKVAADKVRNGYAHGTLFDINGNKVGSFKFE